MNRSLDGTSAAPMDLPMQADKAFGLGIGAIIMVVSGFAWLGWGFSAAESFQPSEWIVFYVLTLVLLFFAIRAMRRARQLTRLLHRDGSKLWAAKRTRFLSTALFEGVGCGVVVLFAIVFHRMDLLAAGISLVVAIHFFLLAGLMRFHLYFLPGIAILLVDIAGVAHFRGTEITLATATATGVVLWLTALRATVLSAKASQNASATA